ncbi:CDP-glycerol glycerophosphotransferase family protein [Nitrococcus mobilis]|nr:CDP-glycerol glycerophosphotransferase family protein [Nitrococcus mobilis]
MSRIRTAIRTLDDAAHSIRRRATRKRKILFHGHNDMNYNMFMPLHKKILRDSHTDVFFLFTNEITKKNEHKSEFPLNNTKQHIESDKIISAEKAKYMKWDAILDSDLHTPWFYRNATFIQIFHGVAAKAVTLENGTVVNYNYHPNLRNYDVCFFANKTFLCRTKDLNLWKNSDSGELIGLCCLDNMIKKNNQQSINYVKNILVPERFRSKQIILYAPSWGNHNSLVRKGEEILAALAQKDIFVIVKPHPNFVFDSTNRTEISLKKLLERLFKDRNYSLITDSPYDAALISDALISDFGSLALEYTLLRKPIFLFQGTDQLSHIADLDQFNMFLKCSYPFHENKAIDKKLFTIAPLSKEQRLFMEEFEEAYFANVGRATDAAFNALVRRDIICRK